MSGAAPNPPAKRVKAAPAQSDANDEVAELDTTTIFDAVTEFASGSEGDEQDANERRYRKSAFSFDDEDEILYLSDQDQDEEPYFEDDDYNYQDDQNTNDGQDEEEDDNQDSIARPQSALARRLADALKSLNDRIAKGDKGQLSITPSKQKLRYFIPSELVTRCYACRGTGHNARDCPRNPSLEPCSLCALPGHTLRACPNAPCATCNRYGHQTGTCGVKTEPLMICIICGSTKHRMDKCRFSPIEHFPLVKHLRCVVCGQKGHLNCAVVLGSEQFKRMCHNCGSEKHVFEECKESKFNVLAPENNIILDGRGRLGSPGAITCFTCNRLGHRSSDCPERQHGRHRSPANRESDYGPICNNCGLRGHIARQCPNYGKVHRGIGNARYSPVTPTHGQRTHRRF